MAVAELITRSKLTQKMTREFDEREEPLGSLMKQTHVNVLMEQNTTNN